MGGKVPRRDLLWTLGAAAVGTTACSKPGVVASLPTSIRFPRVNVICHGMLLFWQDRANPRNGVTVYAPHTSGMHEVRLSASLGGEPNLFGAMGAYALRFTTATPGQAGPRDKSKDVVLYDEGSAKGLSVEGANSMFSVALPYPTDVRRLRVMRFPNDPPYSTSGSNTQADFGVRPGEMAGMNILTYDRVNSPITLEKPDGSTQPVASSVSRVLNMYLYSSPPELPVTNHLRFFNRVLKYTGHTELDLAVTRNLRIDRTDKEQEVLPFDLSRLDIYDLFELEDFGQRNEDPVGCLQGWGS